MLPPNFLAVTPDSISPSFVGMVVIVGLQLSQFFFNYRKDQSREQSAKKQDLTELRKELKSEIEDLAAKVESNRAHTEQSRNDMQEKINKVAIDTSALVKGQEMTEQALVSLAHKIDTLVSRPNTRR